MYRRVAPFRWQGLLLIGESLDLVRHAADLAHQIY
jgi:hypothetical protein